MARKHTENTAGEFHPVTLENDQGADISFRGALYAQTSFYEENTGILTKQELYTTEEGDQAFSLVSSGGDSKERRAYIVKREGEQCTMIGGEETMTLPFDWLMMFTQALWDIDLERQRQNNSLVSTSQTVNE